MCFVESVLDQSLGGFQFKTVDGEKQVSTDGGNTWENFSSGLVSVTESFSLTNPILNVVGLNSSAGFVIYTLYPIDFTNIDSITYQFQHIMNGTRNACVSITDEQLTTNDDIVNNAVLTVSCTSSNNWVTESENNLDTSAFTGKKYIGITVQNYTSSVFFGLVQFMLNKRQ